jgi:selenocysteine lyase/cysteine desulfurase
VLYRLSHLADLSPGSFGTYPIEVRSVLRHHQDLSEERPDVFIRYDYPKMLDESRKAVAELLNAPVEGCVFVPNASNGTNTVLRNLVYQPGDVVIYFATVYGACGKTVTYITETTPATSHMIEYTYPLPDPELCTKFEDAVKEIKANGKNPRVAIYDTIASQPGVRMPFERLTEICRQHGVLSFIDGAHCVGGIPIDLTNLDPDFYVSNCHKWLHVPRGCAVLYVPERHHHLMRSTLPTSHGFVPAPTNDGSPAILSPLPPSAKSEFVNSFEFVGTVDNSPVLCVPAAIEWRRKLTWNGKQGEEAIYAYIAHIVREAGDFMASALGTAVMDNSEGTLTDCFFSNVRLPLSFKDLAQSDTGKAWQILHWMSRVLVNEYDTFMGFNIHGGAWWVRLSGQVYLTKEDFEWGTDILKQVCERVKKGEWQSHAV